MKKKRNIFFAILLMVLVCCGTIVAFAGSQSSTWYINGKAKLNGNLSTVTGYLLASDEAKAVVEYAGTEAANVKVKVDLLNKNGKAKKTSGWICKIDTASTDWIKKAGAYSAKAYYNYDDGAGYMSSSQTLSAKF